jgi:hypothetical protein
MKAPGWYRITLLLVNGHRRIWNNNEWRCYVGDLAARRRHQFGGMANSDRQCVAMFHTWAIFFSAIVASKRTKTYTLQISLFRVLPETYHVFSCNQKQLSSNTMKQAYSNFFMRVIFHLTKINWWCIKCMKHR